MKIQIQSFIDLITNSSTETFTILSDNAQAVIYDIVNSILKVAGSNKSFDDLFDYEEEYDDKWEDCYYDYLAELINDKDGSVYVQGLCKVRDYVYNNFSSWKDGEQEIRKLIDKAYADAVVKELGALTYKEYCDDKSDDWYDTIPATKTFTVTPKKGLESNEAQIAATALNAINNLFDTGYAIG